MNVIRRVFFLSVLTGLSLLCFRIFQYKVKYLAVQSDFKKCRPGSIEVMVFGSSHAYCSVNPVLLFREYGIVSYVLATDAQRIEFTYDYIRRAIREQHPKVVVLETYMLTANPKDAVPEARIHSALDPIPLDVGKIASVFAVRRQDGAENYLIPFLKYHVRWRELKRFDFQFQNPLGHIVRGFDCPVTATPIMAHAVDLGEIRPVPIPEQNEEWLNRILSLTTDNDCELMLLTAPWGVRESLLPQYRYMSNWARKHHVPYVDMNQDFAKIGMDPRTDFFGAQHLNIYGAEKATRYLGHCLVAHYDFNTNHTAEVESAWAVESARYDQRKAEARSRRY